MYKREFRLGMVQTVERGEPFELLSYHNGYLLAKQDDKYVVCCNPHFINNQILNWDSKATFTDFEHAEDDFQVKAFHYFDVMEVLQIEEA